VLDFRRFEDISFDCYGTLIDWESGILGALRTFREANAVRAADDELLDAYASLEVALEAGDYLRYGEVLRGVMRGLAMRFAVPLDRVDTETLVASLPGWRPFPDTIPALRRLKERCRLAVISNTDDDLFAQTARALEVPFDWVITAEQVRAYKPSRRNFERALQVMGVAKERVLHAAQSRYHDVAPASAMGIATAWVNRRTGRKGGGATAPSQARPDLEVPDLKTLADRVEAGA
jgi:2-haloacid dehalogenase